jgi:hypothetical protein
LRYEGALHRGDFLTARRLRRKFGFAARTLAEYADLFHPEHYAYLLHDPKMEQLTQVARKVKSGFSPPHCDEVNNNLPNAFLHYFLFIYGSLTFGCLAGTGHRRVFRRV